MRIRVTEHRFIHALLHLIEELKTLGLLANMSCGTLKKKSTMRKYISRKEFVLCSVEHTL